MLDIVGSEPVFETGLLLAGDVDPSDVRRQLSRWERAGKVVQLRRGLYSLAPPFLKSRPHPFVVANRLVTASYVSMESALSFYGLIPEYVPVATSVTTGRPGTWETPMGTFLFRHVSPGLFFGYEMEAVSPGQEVFLATPEKALLDLLYLRPRSDSPAFLSGLRLQNMDRLDLAELRRQATRFDSGKLLRAVAAIEGMAASETEGYEAL